VLEEGVIELPYVCSGFTPANFFKTDAYKSRKPNIVKTRKDITLNNKIQVRTIIPPFGFRVFFGTIVRGLLYTNEIYRMAIDRHDEGHRRVATTPALRRKVNTVTHRCCSPKVSRRN